MIVRIRSTRTAWARWMTIETAAEMMRLSTDEIAWAIEEHGECATDEFVIDDAHEA